MADRQRDDRWPADWASVSAEQRRAWRDASPDDRLRWLEDALTFAMETGALARDRDRRAVAARRWQRLESPQQRHTSSLLPSISNRAGWRT